MLLIHWLGLPEQCLEEVIAFYILDLKSNAFNISPLRMTFTEGVCVCPLYEVKEVFFCSSFAKRFFK